MQPEFLYLMSSQPPGVGLLVGALVVVVVFNGALEVVGGVVVIKGVLEVVLVVGLGVVVVDNGTLEVV